MKNTQGAPAQPEDPTQDREELEQPDAGEPQQEPVTAEPTATADAAEPEATPTDTPDASAEEPAAGGDEAPKEQKPAAPADAKPSKPVDPVEAAKARLTGGKPDAQAKPAGTTPATKPGTQPQQPQGQQPQAAKPETLPAGDPIATWTPSERQHTKGTVKERFRQLHRELEETRPVAELGKAWDGLIREEQLVEAVKEIGDDGVAWGIRANHATQRVVTALRSGRQPDPRDLATYDQLRQGIDAVDQALGRRAPSAIEPLQGDLPADMRELVELGVPEADVRLLAAAKAARGTAAQTQREQQEQARRAKAAADAEQAVRGPQQRAPAQQNQRQAPASPWSDADFALQRNQTLADLGQLVRVDVRTKEGQAKAFAFAEQHLAPHLAEILSEANPKLPSDQAFAQLSPHGRRDLYREAIKRYREAIASTPTPAAPRHVDRPLRTRPTQPAATTPMDPVAAARARLVGSNPGE